MCIYNKYKSIKYKTVILSNNSVHRCHAVFYSIASNFTYSVLIDINYNISAISNS